MYGAGDACEVMHDCDGARRQFVEVELLRNCSAPATMKRYRRRRLQEAFPRLAGEDNGHSSSTIAPAASYASLGCPFEGS